MLPLSCYPSLILIGSDCSLAISNGREHHSELQIFSLSTYDTVFDNDSCPSTVFASSSVGTSENNITRLS